MRHALRFLLRIALSILLLGTIVWAIDSAGVYRRLTSADFSWFFLAVILGIVANIFSAWRWQIIAQKLGLATNTHTLLSAYGQGVTLNTILPGATLGGDAYRAVALQKLGNPMLKAAASVALDRLSGLWALFVISWLAWLGFALSPSFTLQPGALVFHVAALSLAVIAPFGAGWLNQQLSLDPKSLPTRFLQLFSETARLAQATFLSSLLVQLATIASLWAALHAVNPEVPVLYLIAIAAPVFLATALPLSVGGYGTREAAMATYYLLAGLPPDIAVAGALLHGLAVTLQGILWAPLFLLDAHREK